MNIELSPNLFHGIVRLKTINFDSNKIKKLHLAYFQGLTKYRFGTIKLKSLIRIC